MPAHGEQFALESCFRRNVRSITGRISGSHAEQVKALNDEASRASTELRFENLAVSVVRSSASDAEAAEILSQSAFAKTDAITNDQIHSLVSELRSKTQVDTDTVSTRVQSLTQAELFKRAEAAKTESSFADLIFSLRTSSRSPVEIQSLLSRTPFATVALRGNPVEIHKFIDGTALTYPIDHDAFTTETHAKVMASLSNQALGAENLAEADALNKRLASSGIPPKLAAEILGKTPFFRNLETVVPDTNTYFHLFAAEEPEKLVEWTHGKIAERALQLAREDSFSSTEKLGNLFDVTEATREQRDAGYAASQYVQKVKASNNFLDQLVDVSRSHLPTSSLVEMLQASPYMKRMNAMGLGNLVDEIRGSETHDRAGIAAILRQEYEVFNKGTKNIESSSRYDREVGLNQVMDQCSTGTCWLQSGKLEDVE